MKIVRADDVVVLEGDAWCYTAGPPAATWVDLDASPRWIRHRGIDGDRKPDIALTPK
jgi:hypothetical protein